MGEGFGRLCVSYFASSLAVCACPCSSPCHVPSFKALHVCGCLPASSSSPTVADVAAAAVVTASSSAELVLPLHEIDQIKNDFVK